MPYATQSELIDRYSERMLVQLTDRGATPTGMIDAAVVARALADTDAMIDGYLLGRYALPLTATPALLKDIALVVAVYKLHRKSPDEKIAKDYDDALRSLREIAAGVVRLNVAGAEPAASGSTGVKTNEPDRRLSADSLSGFI